MIRDRRATKRSLDEGRQDEGRQDKSREHQCFVFLLAQYVLEALELKEGFANHLYRVFSVVSHQNLIS